MNLHCSKVGILIHFQSFLSIIYDTIHSEPPVLCAFLPALPQDVLFSLCCQSLAPRYDSTCPSYHRVLFLNVPDDQICSKQPKRKISFRKIERNGVPGYALAHPPLEGVAFLVPALNSTRNNPDAKATKQNKWQTRLHNV
jgi:hypothetical protein